MCPVIGPLFLLFLSSLSLILHWDRREQTADVRYFFPVICQIWKYFLLSIFLYAPSFLFHQDILGCTHLLISLPPVCHRHFSLPLVHYLHYSFTMDLRDELQEEKLDTSPSVSSGSSSWTSFDLSTDLTSVSSDQASTPVAAPCGCKLFDDRHLKKSSSVKVSSDLRISKVAWRETSFLGSDE